MQTRPYRTEFPYNLLDVISFQARRSTEYIETVPATFESDYTQLTTKLFTERQCAVLNARYKNNASYKSIAQELGVSLPRVGQILEHMCRILAQDENWNILTGRTSTCRTCCSAKDASISDLNTQLVKASCICLNSIALGIPSNIVERLNVVGIIYLADLLLCSGYDLSCTPGITSDISSLLVKKLEQLGCSAAHLGSVSNKVSPYESCPYASRVLSPENGIVEFAVRKRLSTIADFPAMPASHNLLCSLCHKPERELPIQTASAPRIFFRPLQYKTESGESFFPLLLLHCLSSIALCIPAEYCPHF